MVPEDPLARIVGAIGRPAFGPVLMAVLAERIEADMCSAFALTETAPEVLLAESREPDRTPFARIASIRYAERYWRRDVETLYNLGRAHRTVLAARRAARSIRDIDYRLECYGAGAVGERLSVCRADPVGVIVNAYRDMERGPFQPAQIDWMERAAQILVAATARHHALTLEAGRPAAATEAGAGAAATALLLRQGAGLSLREAQVLAAAARGAGQDETAAELGLKLSSIKTYRRRGYSKLGVSDTRRLRDLVAALEAGEDPPGPA